MLNLDIIEGIEYKCPPRPKLSEIRNYGLPRIKQIWSRHDEYEQYDWTDGWEHRATPEQIEYLNGELDRLYNGEWIFWDGQPLYINNYFYFFLQWMYLENEYYPEFRDSSLYYFRFIEICKNSKLCWGSILIKGRRLGASSMEASIQLLNGLIERNSRQGIISKTGDDAKDIYDFIVISFEALPKFLQPSIEGTHKSGMAIKKPATRITKDNKQTNKREGLNNFIGHKKTALNSWDSGKIFRILIDEAGKWLEVDISTYLKIVGKTLTKGANVTGKASVVSTVNKGDKGGERFKIVWEQSDQSKVNRLGQTASKLFRIFIGAMYGYEGYIDRYGRSVVEDPTPEQTEWLKNDPRCPDPNIGSKQYLQMQRDLLANDEEGLQEEIRQAPFTWQEVFETAGRTIHFDRKSHEAQLALIKERLTEEGKDTEKGELGRRGWFKETLDGDAYFVDDPKGMWYIHQFPEKPNLYEKSQISGKPKYKPTGTAYGGAGLDPIAHSDAVVDGTGSDAAVTIRRRYTVLDPENSGCPVAFMIGRMDRKSDFHKQVYLGIKYYGVRMLGERAPSDWVDWGKENGYEQYLIGTQRSDKTWVYGAAPQNKEYIEEHLSEMVESSYNDVEKIWYRRLIQDRLDFDINKRTDYDGAISDGNALIACKEPVRDTNKKITGKKFITKGKISTYN